MNKAAQFFAEWAWLMFGIGVILSRIFDPAILKYPGWYWGYMLLTLFVSMMVLLIIGQSFTKSFKIDGLPEWVSVVTLLLGIALLYVLLSQTAGKDEDYLIRRLSGAR